MTSSVVNHPSSIAGTAGVAPPAMTSGPPSPNIPYLGSKISLISKAKIRYEGILYTIDPQQSTVALAKVRSYGTEDRPVDSPLPPKDEIYEYIIFRATDIEDLQVSEPPRPTCLQEAFPHMDPAIIQHAPPTYIRHQAPAVNRPRHPGRSGSPGFLDNRTAPLAALVRGQQMDSRRRVRTVAPPNIFRQNAYRTPGNAAMQQAQFYYRRPSNRSGSFGLMQSFQRSPRLRNRSIGGGTLKFDGDFDFEKANEEFSKLEQKFEAMTVTADDGQSPSEAAKPVSTVAVSESAPKPPESRGGDDPKPRRKTTTPVDVNETEKSCYDRNKSFFDTISCEALEREKGRESAIRRSWQEERHQNAETFGTFSGNERYSNRFGGIGGVRTMPRQLYGGGPRRYGAQPSYYYNGGGGGGSTMYGSGQRRFVYSGQGSMGGRRYYGNGQQVGRYYQGNGRAELPAWYYDAPSPPQMGPYQQRYSAGNNDGYAAGNRRVSADYRTNPAGVNNNNNYSRRYPVYG